jgi:DNA-binding response OmpR family regulator
MKILLAEDDNNISTIAKMALEHVGGHEVDVADNGATALEKALQGDYDLILLDEMMPQMNGLSVCRKYHEVCADCRPVIFLSAKSQDSDIAEFNALGLGHIPKPFDPMQLSQQIATLLDGLAEKAG